MWENIFETFEKLFSMIMSGCIIYSNSWNHNTDIIMNFGTKHL